MPQIHELSVVMSVYNSAKQLNATIKSILQQTFADFEFIIVNDGSTDDSREILEKFAAGDPRIRLFNQPNRGLTHALIFACQQANGRYIARQDAGDRSTPERLKTQLAYLTAHQDCAAVFSHYNTVDELGHTIYEHTPGNSAVQSAIQIDDHHIATPSHHGTVMFSKTCYLKAGGYRREFHFTQDLDLWIRMSEHGRIHLIEQRLYDALIATNTISGRYHSLQKKYHDIIIESAQQRRNGKSDAAALTRASAIKPARSVLQLIKNQSATLYFIASCLIAENPSLARYYLKKTLRTNPLHLKAWYKLLVKT